MRSSTTLLAVLALVLGLAACGSGEQPAASTELGGTVLDPPFELADPTLTDTSGEPFRLAGDTDAPLTLLFFGYSNCQDVCGIVLQNLAAALRRLEEPEREQVEVVVVTSDPKRDTPEVLRAYLDQFDPSFVGLTGDLDDIVAAGKSVATYIDEGEKLPSGGYDPGTHGTRVIAVDSADEATLMWASDTPIATYVQDIRILLGEESA